MCEEILQKSEYKNSLIYNKINSSKVLNLIHIFLEN